MTARPTPLMLASFLAVCGGVGGSASAQVFNLGIDATLDRWMYPFNGSPGTRLSASIFGAPRLEGFDDYDAQFVVGFQTEEDVPTGLAASSYRVISATVYAVISNNMQFRYDPTYDNQNTYQNQVGEYPGYVPDSDPGRPISLWGVGYRDGYSLANWGETSPFGFNPLIPPAQEGRVIYMASFDAAGVPTDASNHLKAEIDLAPAAIGRTSVVTPGDLVPADTEFAFQINLCDPGMRAFLTESLSAGELRLAIASLHPATGGKGGGSGDVTYPIFYTRENPIAQIFGFSPHLELEVRVGSAGDYNGDGIRNFFDISEFLNDFNAGRPAADMNTDCTLNFFDISIFLSEFNAAP